MLNVHEERLKTKLLFWSSPGFSQFLADLQDQCGPETNILGNAETLRKKYKKALDDMEEKKLKLKQGKLPL